MSFANTAKQLDNLIARLENELGAPSVCINPDDPWAQHHIQNRGVSRSVQVKQCVNCEYKLTLPFERFCPICQFKKQSADAFYLPSVEEMLSSLPARVPVPEKQAKPAPAKKEAQKAAPAAEKPAASAPVEKKPESGPAPPVDPAALDAAWSKVGVRVGKVVDVKPHPAADALWICQVDLAEASPRQVCAGLRNYYEANQLNGRFACVITNLKPSKLKGELSAAMLLAGSAGPQVRLLEPPAGSAVGDAIYLEGQAPAQNVPKALNSKLWKDVVSAFKVKGGKAVVGDKVVVTAKGPVLCDLPDGSEIH